MNTVIINSENIAFYVAKFIEETATPVEIKAIESWRLSNLENEKHYQHLLQVDEWYSDMQSQQIDTKSAWKIVNNKMHVPAKSKKNNSNIIGYAAAIAILSLIVWFAWSSNTKSASSIQYATSDSAKEHILKDGSIINLKPNSALSSRLDSERTYYFHGAANFEIIHDEQRPFTILIDDIIVKDLGTIFDINAQPNNDTVFVKVIEGIVQFYTLENEGLLVEEGEEGMYIKSKNQFLKRSIESRNSVLSIAFNNTPLNEVIDHLAYAFRKNVELKNDSIGTCNITVDFVKAPLNIVKEIIEETLSISIENSNDTLVFKGKGCN